MNILSALTERFSAWQQYRQSVRELSRLDDRELTDLGIARCDIDYVAKSSAGLVKVTGSVANDRGARVLHA